MRRHASVLLLAALAWPSLSAAQESDEEATGVRSRPTYDLVVRALAGPFQGAGVREEGGTAILLETDFTPKLGLGDWTLAAPLRLDHRETPGAQLRETTVGAGFDATWRATRQLRLTPLAAITYVRRPGWEELYLRPGEPATTDRYSYLTWKAGGELWQSFGSGRHLRAQVTYVSYTYERSPAFLETDPTPSHLVPADNHQLRVDTSFRMKRAPWTFTVRADGYVRYDEVQLARSAGTGGLATSHPLQELAGIVPSVKLAFRPGRTEVWVDYAYTHQTDRYEGYYTHDAHELRAGVEARVTGRSTAQLRIGGRWQLGGPDSRSGIDGNGASRTEDGNTLYYRGWEAMGEYAWQFRKDLAVVVEARVLQRWTNYPDYVPGSYPSPTSTYDIKWDFTNWRVLVGFEWRPEFGESEKKDEPAPAPAAPAPAAAKPKPEKKK